MCACAYGAHTFTLANGLFYYSLNIWCIVHGGGMGRMGARALPPFIFYVCYWSLSVWAFRWKSQNENIACLHYTLCVRIVVFCYFILFLFCSVLFLYIHIWNVDDMMTMMMNFVGRELGAGWRGWWIRECLWPLLCVVRCGFFGASHPPFTTVFWNYCKFQWLIMLLSRRLRRRCLSFIFHG